VTNMHRLIGSP